MFNLNTSQFIFSILFLFPIIYLQGQSPNAISKYGLLSSDAGFNSAINPWFGAKVGATIYGEKGLEDDAFATGFFQLYPFDKKNSESSLTFPVITNISRLKTKLDISDIDLSSKGLRALISDERGISVGIFPTYDFSSKSKNEGHSVAYLGGSAKYNLFNLEDSTSTEGLLQFRIGGGYEIGFGEADFLKIPGAKRFYFSVTPVITIFDSGEFEKLFKDNISQSTSIEFTGIMAISKGIGLVVEYNYNFDVKGTLNIGLVYGLASNKEQN